MWRLRATVSEAVRNLDVRMLVPFAVALAIVIAVALAEGSLTNQLLVQEQDRVDAGAYVLLVEGARAGDIDAARCEAAVEIEGVVAAGSVAARLHGSVESVVVQKLPGTMFTTMWVTPGMLRVWYPQASWSDMSGSEGGVVVGSEAARELAVTSGMAISIPAIGEAIPIAAVVSSDVRAPRFSRKVAMVRAPVGAADSCWIEFELAAYSAAPDVVAGWFRENRTNTVRELRTRSVLGVDPARALAERPQRFAWVAGGVILALTWLSSWWMRRSELGIYRTLGMSSRHMVVMGLVQALVVSLWAAAVGLSVAGGIHVLTTEYFVGDQLTIMARSALGALLLGISIGVVAPILVSGGSIAQQLKDRG